MQSHAVASCVTLDKYLNSVPQCHHLQNEVTILTSQILEVIQNFQQCIQMQVVVAAAVVVIVNSTQ